LCLHLNFSWKCDLAQLKLLVCSVRKASSTNYGLYKGIIGTMIHKSSRNYIVLSGLLILAFVLTACGQSNLKPTPVVEITAPIPVQTTPAPAETGLPSAPDVTPTPEIPLAARVNGIGIPLSVYQPEVERLVAAGTVPVEQAGQVVLAAMVDEILLSQAAYQAGFNLDEAALAERLVSLAAGAGGEQALVEWQTANGYAPESFRHALAQSAAAAWMRDQIANQVPETAEQVHVQQILLYNLNEATQILTQVRSGTSFASLAARQDPVNAGDLGWFPRGYLPESPLEQAAFTLNTGEISEIIETPLGFHILQVLEVSESQPLLPQARLVLQKQAVQNWLQEHRSRAEIII
jgi:peptidyl-prolyl cis-trans isomerase C